jgi:hypothetical protein
MSPRRSSEELTITAALNARVLHKPQTLDKILEFLGQSAIQTALC